MATAVDSVGAADRLGDLGAELGRMHRDLFGGFWLGCAYPFLDFRTDISRYQELFEATPPHHRSA